MSRPTAPAKQARMTTQFSPSSNRWFHDRWRLVGVHFLVATIGAACGSTGASTGASTGSTESSDSISVGAFDGTSRPSASAEAPSSLGGSGEDMRRRDYRAESSALRRAGPSRGPTASGVDDDAADVLAVAHRFVSLVHLIERVPVGDQFIELQRAVAVH